MTCPHRDAIYGHPWLGRAPAEPLRVHAEGCEDCRATVTRLESARRLLAEDVPALDRRHEAKTWAAIEQRTARAPWWQAPRLLVAATAVALVVLFAMQPRTDDFVLEAGAVTAEGVRVTRLPSGVPIEVREAATIVRDDVAISASPGAALTLETTAVVRVDAGELVLDVGDRAAPVLVAETPHAKLTTIGGRLYVRVDDASTVRVERGRVRIEPLRGEGVELGAAQRWSSQDEAPKNRADLTRARALVVDDAPRARQLAKGVLEREAAGPEEVEALAVLADIHRRSHEYALAAEFYERVAKHASGRSYAEEALLRRARMLLAIDAPEPALDALADAARRFAGGPLEPERIAVAARAWLAKGDSDRAIELLESSRRDSLSVREACRVVADAIGARHPAYSRMKTCAEK